MDFLKFHLKFIKTIFPKGAKKYVQYRKTRFLSLKANMHYGMKNTAQKPERIKDRQRI